MTLTPAQMAVVIEAMDLRRPVASPSPSQPIPERVNDFDTSWFGI
jgi:hypothetical protein